MKIPLSRAPLRRQAGIFLIECLVYLAVFVILLGVGMGAFYLCWNQSRALISAADDISLAMRVGEYWRADVRKATGKISVENLDGGERLRIPTQNREIVYRFAGGELRREFPATHVSQLLLPKVESSQMTLDARPGVTAWRWELQLKMRHPETQLPLLFTFDAVPKNP